MISLAKSCAVMLAAACAGCATMTAATMTPAMADVVVYPATNGLPASPLYRVELRDADGAATSHVYLSEPRGGPEERYAEAASFTTFEMSGPVEVRIRLNGDQKSADNFIVRPRRLGLAGAVVDGVATFTLPYATPVSVEFDGDASHPLLLFASDIEDDAPVAGAPGVLTLAPGDHQDTRALQRAETVVFAPGVHQIGADFPIRSDQRFHLAGGAVVKGTIRGGENVSRASVTGNGILSGSDIPGRTSHAIIIRGNGGGNTITDVTSIDPGHYHFVLRGPDNYVARTEMIGWLFSSDGVGTGRDSLIEDNFVMVNDDAFKLYADNTVIRRNTVWQGSNGAVFQISWNINNGAQNIRAYDIDVIHFDHRGDANNRGLFGAVHGGEGHMRDYWFENIRVEGDVYRPFKITLNKTRWAPEAAGWGKITDLNFRNIAFDAPAREPSEIRVIPDENIAIDDLGVVFQNFVFEDWKVAGAAVGEDNPLDAVVDERSVLNIIARPHRPADAVAPETSGLVRTRFVGDFSSRISKRFPDWSEWRASAPARVASIALDEGAPASGSAQMFAGYMKAETAGEYRFRVTTDDVARVYIGDWLVVERDGGAPSPTREGAIALEAGWHALRIDAFDVSTDDNQTLSIEFAAPGEGFAPLTASHTAH